MSHRKIDEWVRKGLLHNALRDEAQAKEAKERVWSNIEKKKRLIPWGMLSALAASVLLLVACGILFLQLEKRQCQINEMAAHIHSLEKQREVVSKRTLREDLPSPIQDEAPVFVKPVHVPAKYQEQQTKVPEMETPEPKERTKPIAGRPRMLTEIPVPKINLRHRNEGGFLPVRPASQGLKTDVGREATPKNKLRIRFGNEHLSSGLSRHLALHIQL